METISSLDQHNIEHYAIFFDTLQPLHLRCLPKKQQKRIDVLTIIASVFFDDVTYTEQEVNDLLRPICDDYVGIRRALIDYRILTRSTSGSQYHKIKQP